MSVHNAVAIELGSLKRKTAAYLSAYLVGMLRKLMSDKSKTKDLAGRIIATEIDLNIMEMDLLGYNEDLAYMSKLINTLTDNIRLLKRPEVVVVASEYRRSMMELDFVRSRQERTVTLRNNVAVRIERLQKEYELFMKEYDDDYRNREKEKVILLFRKKKSDSDG